MNLLTKKSVYNTHTHTFNGPFSRTTRVSRYQKGKTNLDFTETRDSEWQWHRLGHMQVCTSLQTDNHASTPPLSFYRLDALPATQPTVWKHWRELKSVYNLRTLSQVTRCASHLFFAYYICVTFNYGFAAFAYRLKLRQWSVCVADTAANATAELRKNCLDC